MSDQEASLFLATLRRDPKAANKARHREELLESLPNNAGPRIAGCHAELQKLADTLDEKVGSLLDAHEKDFFLAYRQHMLSVQKEFKTLKTKADEHETKSRRQAKISSLEKELRWFMKEALRLDDLCKRYKTELERWKQHADQLEDDRSFLEHQIKKSRGQNKALRASVEKAQQKAYEVLNQVNDDKEKSMPAIEDGTTTDSKVVNIKELTPDMEVRYQKTIQTLQHLLKIEQSRVRKLDSVLKKTPQPSPLEEFFVSCIETVQHQIADRRTMAQNPSANPNPNHQSISAVVNPSTIRLKDFTAFDRRSVIDLLLRNQELLDLLENRLKELKNK